MNERINRISWQKLFIEITKTVALRSQDPHTQVGAVLVKDNRILAIGYNGCPTNFSFDFDWQTNIKYTFCVHAEANALSNAARVGASVDGSDLYITMSPCNECIKLLIQAGVKNVYYLDTYKDFELTKLMAENTNMINLIKIDENNI